MSAKGPVKGTFIVSNRYYLVKAEGKRRVWVKLTKVKEGLPAFLRALADVQEKEKVEPDSVAMLCADWQRDVMPRHAPKTQKDETAICKSIAESFSKFRAEMVRPPDVADYLRPLMVKPRTYNAYRGMLRELMRYAEERGYREPGTNPVTALRTMSTPPRNRYITDSELRRIKVAAMYGKAREVDKKLANEAAQVDKEDERHGDKTRSGPMLCALIDMAYLTGQRIGDLLSLEWSAFGRDGIAFQPAKTKGSTGARVLIEWSPKLFDVERRLKALRVERAGFARQVFTTQSGTAYTYWGASTAWRRACERAGIKAHFHDIRARALTDKEAREGMQQARRMGAHSTEQQTASYVRNRSATKTGATR